MANWLWIGDDEIFVNVGTRLQKGAAASVDTNDAFHDYRIEFHGTSKGSSFDVFYDDAFKLTGSLFLDDVDQRSAGEMWPTRQAVSPSGKATDS